MAESYGRNSAGLHRVPADMRTSMLAVLLLANFAVHAAEHPWRVSVLATDISNQRIHAWDDGFNAGVGVAVSYAPTEAWDAELSVA